MPGRTGPSTGHSEACKSKKNYDIIESAGSASGTFRIESTGFSGSSVALAGRDLYASRLPQLRVFQQLRGRRSDHDIPDTDEWLEHYYAARKAGGWLGECPPIPFIGEDALNGPFHTNDAVSICQEGANSPSFGRNLSDTIEMNGGHYAEGGCGGTPEIKGKYVEAAPNIFRPKRTQNFSPRRKGN